MHIIVAIITDGLWERFVGIMGLKHLDTEENRGQPGRWKNRQSIMSEVSQLLATEDNQVWLDRLQKDGIPCAPVNTFASALSDPHVLDRGMVVEVQHPHGQVVKQVGNPIKLSDYPHETYQSPPLLGQNTDAVLTRLLGLDDDTLSGLRCRGVIQ